MSGVEVLDTVTPTVHRPEHGLLAGQVGTMDATKTYLIEVFWSEEDGGFIAVAPHLPGCRAYGDAAAESIQDIEDAMQSWLEVFRTMGRPFPKPVARARRAV
jgi:predicted RNase H-like HicB family nuclease